MWFFFCGFVSLHLKFSEMYIKWPLVTSKLGKCLKTMIDTRISFSFRILLTAVVCLHTFCNPFPRSLTIGNSWTAVATYQKYLHLHNVDGTSNSKFISFCTSIDRIDAQQQINKLKHKEKPQRFIHPQVCSLNIMAFVVKEVTKTLHDETYFYNMILK